jgi:hypothetical protein
MWANSLPLYEPSVTANRELLTIASAIQVSFPTMRTFSHNHVDSHFSNTSQKDEGTAAGGGVGEYDRTLTEY